MLHARDDEQGSKISRLEWFRVMKGGVQDGNNGIWRGLKLIDRLVS